MRLHLFPRLSLAALLLAVWPALAQPGSPQPNASTPGMPVQLGARPFFLLDDMTEGPLKQRLLACAAEGRFRPSGFSIGHRGAPLQFPEHTRESYLAAARMGAGVIECDVTFTRDKALVCRHAQNDLHTTTNILLTPLAARCTQAFEPAVLGGGGEVLKPARAECRTSDLTLAEFKTLRGKMDGFNPAAQTPAQFVAGTAPWRTDLYAGPGSGTLMTHAESIALFQRLGVKMAPELKRPVVPMPFEGFTQQAYAQALVHEYQQAGVAPEQVFAQSFHLDDVLYWVQNEPAFGRQAVLLNGAGTPSALPDRATLQAYRAQGVRIWAPPLFALLAAEGGRSVPSRAARDAQAAGLQLITWTLERSGRLADGRPGWYFQTLGGMVQREGDVYEVLHTLAQDVGVIGVFSDWPATTTFYASCMGLK